MEASTTGCRLGSAPALEQVDQDVHAQLVHGAVVPCPFQGGGLAVDMSARPGRLIERDPTGVKVSSAFWIGLKDEHPLVD